MEDTAGNESARLVEKPSEPPRVAKPWVKNLLAGQGFTLPEKTQFWWGVRLRAFLGYVRKRGAEIPLEQLVADYLEGLRIDQPPMPPWRLEQARLTLEVFVRGIDHWRWETDPQRGRVIRFRLKCSVEPAGVDGFDSGGGAQRNGPARDRGGQLTEGDNRQVTETPPAIGSTGEKQPSGPSNREPAPELMANGAAANAEATIERLRREIRLAHYSLRTEQSYTEAVARFLKHSPERLAGAPDGHPRQGIPGTSRG